MEDRDIIKALECCSSTQVNACDDCPFYERCYNNDEFIEKEAIDLINRQKAEIERLERHTEMYHEVRAEAVKEFAKRFENELTKIEEIYFDEEHENFISANKVIALLVNLVKEMVGEG